MDNFNHYLISKQKRLTKNKWLNIEIREILIKNDCQKSEGRDIYIQVSQEQLSYHVYSNMS